MATIQIRKDDEKRTSIQQIPNATIEPDGRIKLKTTKGYGYIVCGDAAKALGLDPNLAAFDESASEAHYRIDVPMCGKVITIMKLKSKLNPAWVRHNNAHNEGGEGYNPHSKYVNA